MIVLTVVAGNLPPTTAAQNKATVMQLGGGKASSSSLFAPTVLIPSIKVKHANTEVKVEPEVGEILPLNNDIYFIVAENGDSSRQNRISCSSGKLEVNSNNDADMFQKW
jgi:hypothetical protein